MYPILRQLHTDHHHIKLLLRCLDKEVDCFDFDCQRTSDLALMLSAFDYFKVYPDKWHHPSEDIIFNRLLKKNTAHSKIIKQLLQEHQAIISETIAIEKLFRTAADDCIVPTNDLLSSAHHFIALQRSHLEVENKFIYPLMDKAFSAEEWKEIEMEIKVQSDPLFNEQSKVEYEYLYKYIMTLESE